jgi:hypothetical protein
LQIAVLTAAVSIYNLNDYIQNAYAPNSPEVFLYYKTGKCARAVQWQPSTERDLLFFTAGLIFLTAFATLNFLNLASCIALIVGTLRKKKSCLVPYLVLTSLYILLYLALGSWFFMNLTVENSIRNGAVAAIVFGMN